jgi:hypothetical protein
MATYLELYGLKSNDTLRNKVEIACLVAAEVVRSESDQTANHANRLIWAKAVFEQPRIESERMLMAILAVNNTLTTGQITGASDAAIQTAVNNAVNVFAQG